MASGVSQGGLVSKAAVNCRGRSPLIPVITKTKAGSGLNKPRQAPRKPLPEPAPSESSQPPACQSEVPRMVSGGPQAGADRREVTTPQFVTAQTSLLQCIISDGSDCSALTPQHTCARAQFHLSLQEAHGRRNAKGPPGFLLVKECKPQLCNRTRSSNHCKKQTGNRERHCSSDIRNPSEQV